MVYLVNGSLDLHHVGASGSGQKRSNGNRLRHFVSWVPSVRFQPLARALTR